MFRYPIKKCNPWKKNCIYENDEKIIGKKLVIYMDDLTSRDEEKAREKNLKAEQDRQRDEQKARE
jgi:hypothetical protein